MRQARKMVATAGIGVAMVCGVSGAGRDGPPLGPRRPRATGRTHLLKYNAYQAADKEANAREPDWKLTPDDFVRPVSNVGLD